MKNARTFQMREHEHQIEPQREKDGKSLENEEKKK